MSQIIRKLLPTLIITFYVFVFRTGTQKFHPTFTRNLCLLRISYIFFQMTVFVSLTCEISSYFSRFRLNIFIGHDVTLMKFQRGNQDNDFLRTTPVLFSLREKSAFSTIVIPLGAASIVQVT